MMVPDLESKRWLSKWPLWILRKTLLLIYLTVETYELKPIDTTNNTIIFLNGLNENDLKTTNIKDRISVITWARKIVSKHQQLDIVQAKIDIMKHQVKLFIDPF